MKVLRQRVVQILTNPKLTEETRISAIEILSSLTKNDCFLNIVEEPEQNLFPTSQWEMLKSLLNFNNMEEDNKLVMTTHSPYIINYLTLAIKANFVYLKATNSSNSGELTKKINKIVPLNSRVKSSEVVIPIMNI